MKTFELETLDQAFVAIRGLEILDYFWSLRVFPPLAGGIGYEVSWSEGPMFQRAELEADEASEPADAAFAS